MLATVALLLADMADIVGIFMWLVYLVILVGVIVGWWKLFEKAGKPGWASLIPIYNLIVLTEIVGKPLWWGLICLIPCIGIVPFVLISIDVAKCFGKETGYGVGLGLLPMIFYPLLGFSDARYQGPLPQQ